MKKGIDISQFQGIISDAQWQEIKCKCDFVIIRFGYRGYGTGALRPDERLTHNLNACERYGIPYGFYFFTQAINEAEAREEVDLIARTVDISKAQYGVWCDSEDSANGTGRGDIISASDRTKAVRAFCDAVKAKGAVGGVYAGFYWLKDKLIAEAFDNFPIWCPCYLPECLYKGDNLAMWQFCSDNLMKISGFGDHLDCNYLIREDWLKKPDDKASIENKPYVTLSKSLDELAKEVIAGQWGNGSERQQKLVNAGYDYNAVQNRVNEMLNVPNETIYIVKKGDTLSGIAQRFGTTVAKLAQNSGIGNPNIIFPGQKIIVRK